MTSKFLSSIKQLFDSVFAISKIIKVSVKGYQPQPPADDCYLNRYHSSFDKTMTPAQLTAYWPPITSMGKWKLKKPRTINGTRFKFINNFSLLETFKMVDALQISDSCSPFTVLWRFCWRKIEHWIRLNIIKYGFHTHWEMKQREMLTNEQACERIAMDCSCHKHVR